MAHALIIFNGVRFSHDLADKVFAWAKQNSGEVRVLFLTSHETEDKYAFPSDLDAGQNVTDKSDAEQSDMRVIESQVQLMEGMASAENISFNSEILVDPSLDEVVAEANDASAVFVDAREEDEASLMEVRTFKMKELLERLPEGKRMN